MGIRRRIVIPVILALGTAASTLAVSVAPAASSAPAVAMASQMHPSFYYEG